MEKKLFATYRSEHSLKDLLFINMNAGASKDST